MFDYAPYPPSNPPPPLAKNQVHIYLVDLDVPEDRVEHLSRLLSDAERARADRYYFPADRRAYIARHAAVRQILARLLVHTPAELSFATGRFGKPSLAGRAADSQLNFNLSRSASRCLCAVARGTEVGIDIERIRGGFDLEGLAKTEFSEAESSAILSLPPEERGRAFFRCWTRKEAFLKAIGHGLSVPLKHFTVSVGARAELIETLFDPDQMPRWSLADISPSEDTLACLAASRDALAISTWRWPLTQEA